MCERARDRKRARGGGGEREIIPEREATLRPVRRVQHPSVCACEREREREREWEREGGREREREREAGETESEGERERERERWRERERGEAPRVAPEWVCVHVCERVCERTSEVAGLLVPGAGSRGKEIGVTRSLYVRSLGERKGLEGWTVRCRANMAHIGQSRPES